MAGRRAIATGSETAGLRDIWMEALRVAGNFNCAGFRADTIAQWPGFLQRGSTELEERVCLPRDLGAVVWQWLAATTQTLQLDWSVGAPEAGSSNWRWNSGDRWLLIECDTGLMLYCFDRAVRWELSEHDNRLTVQAALVLHAGEAVTLALAATQPGRGWDDVVHALEQPAALVRARESDGQRIERERISIQGGSQEMDSGWRQAVQRLDSFVCAAPAGPPVPITTVDYAGSVAPGFTSRAALLGAAAALAAGDARNARLVLEFLAGTQNGAGQIAGAGDWPGALTYDDIAAAPLFTLLLAQHFAWTGDIGFARRIWPHVRRAVSSTDFSALAADVASTILRELSIAAEGIGERDDGIAFKAQAQQLGAPAQRWWTWLAALSDASWVSPVADVETFLNRWTALRSRSTGQLADHALAVAALLYGLFEIVPEAARQRIELKPQIAREWENFQLNNIRVGDNRFRMHYRRDQAQRLFLLEPLEGMVPLRVILEPVLHASAIKAVTVDGQPAQLNLRRQQDRWACPLQLVLDHERAVVIEIEGD